MEGEFQEWRQKILGGGARSDHAQFHIQGLLNHEIYDEIIAFVWLLGGLIRSLEITKLTMRSLLLFGYLMA